MPSATLRSPLPQYICSLYRGHILLYLNFPADPREKVWEQNSLTLPDFIMFLEASRWLLVESIIHALQIWIQF